MTYVLDGIPWFNQTIRFFYLPLGGHKVTLPIEFQRVKNGTQLDVLVSFEKNLWGVWGRNFPEVILDLSLQSRMYLVLQSHVC